MKSTIGLTISYMKSEIGKSLCDELWDSWDRFDYILKIVWSKIWNKVWMEKWIRFLHSTAHTSSLTQYFIQTIWLLLEEPLDTNNRLLVPCMKWSLDERLQTERTTGRLRFFFLILPVIMCIWVSSSFLTFTSKITFCSTAEKKNYKVFQVMNLHRGTM